MSTIMTDKPRFTRGTPAAKMADPSQRPSTPGQIKFLTDLVTQIAEFDTDRARALWMELREQQASGLVFGAASARIDALKVERAELRAAKNVKRDWQVVDEQPPVPAGRYAIDNEEGATAFYRVAISDDGWMTLFVYASDTQHKLSWKTAQPILKKILAYGLAEASVRFGVESETCYKCGKRLTRTHTRAAGIGDDCASQV